MSDTHHHREKTLAQKLAFLFGVTFLVVGILGFIPGITQNYDELKFAGEDSNAELLGIFQVSILHNIAHMLFGVGILASKRHRSSLQYLLVAGILYLGLFLYGLVVGDDDSANFLPMNSADDWLHLILSLALLGSWAAARGADDPDYIDIDRDRTRREPVERTETPV